MASIELLDWRRATQVEKPRRPEPTSDVKHAITALRSFGAIRAIDRYGMDRRAIGIDELAFAKMPEESGVKDVVFVGLPERIRRLQIYPHVITSGEPHIYAFDPFGNDIARLFVDENGRLTRKQDLMLGVSGSDDLAIENLEEVDNLSSRTTFGHIVGGDFGDPGGSEMFTNDRPNLRLLLVGVRAHERPEEVGQFGHLGIAHIKYFIPVHSVHL